MITRVGWIILAGLLCAGTVLAQPQNAAPRIGYLYPSGGQRGTTFQVTVGGQFLRGASKAHVSGQGVHATLLQYVGRLGFPNKEERDAVMELVTQARDQRLAGVAAPVAITFDESLARGTDETPEKKTEALAFVRHPLLYDVHNSSLRELEHLRHEFQGLSRKRQMNMQIGDTVILEVTIDRDASPGDRELRLKTSNGLTNPLCFQVGALPETKEFEPNDPKTTAMLPEPPPLELPVLLNGQIMPGDVDRYRFKARKGQRLVVQASARSLIPYLADAVPGWFQATLAIYGPDGTRLAFADDYHFHPDPILLFSVPEDGVHTVEIRDAIYRGREDFVYRVAVGELPFITHIFPLGARQDSETVATASGWNLTETALPLDTGAGGDSIRTVSLPRGTLGTNSVLFAVDTLPEFIETEPNSTREDAQRITLPQTVNGRIESPGDVDVYQFDGQEGAEICVDVIARRLYSPVDSIVRLTDASGEVIAWNDDYMPKEEGHLYTGPGLLTHHADSYLRAQLPKTGTYYVQMADAQNRGGEAYGYRMSIAPPRPDFFLRATPSSLNIPAGRAVPVCVHALRRDGFEGDIRLFLKGAPSGFSLDGGVIPAGRNSIRVTVTAPADAPERPFALRVEGRARVGEEMIVRPAIPAEDMMQAFLYRHLAPAQELMVAVKGSKRMPSAVRLAGTAPVRLPRGGSAEIRVQAPRGPMLRDIQLELSDPPEGVTLEGVSVVPEGLAFSIHASEDTANAGLVDNLIVEAFIEREPQNPKPANAGKKERVPLGVLPAIPCAIGE